MPEYDLAAVPAHPSRGPTVVNDLPCTGCGYNLRGIPLSAVCPECGRAVELSLRGELLRFASPAYLKSIDLGLSVVLTSIFAYVLLIILSIGIHFGATTILGSTGVTLLSSGLFFLCDCAFIFGYWKFTEPDPGYTGREKPTSARTIARLAACGTATANLAYFLLEVLGSFAPVIGSFTTIFASLAKLAAWGAWITLFFAIVLYTQHLARRIPDQPLLKQTRTFIWLIPLVGAVGVPLCFVGPIVGIILYATMLQALRTRTKEIIDWQTRGGRHVFGP